MKRETRKTVMWILLVVLFGLLFLGNIGTPEVILWLLLLTAWVAAFGTWAQRGPGGSSR